MKIANALHNANRNFVSELKDLQNLSNILVFISI